MKSEQPIILRIEKVVDEARDIKTFVFEHGLDARPGQFVNVWIPGADEKPFSVSYQDPERFGITCFAVGPFSSKLNTLKEGDKVGIRGPYGNPFTMDSSIRHAVLIGGGCGSAPLAFLANELRKKKIEVDFITGAKSTDYILYADRMERAGVKVHITTDDGSAGFKGFSTDFFASFMERSGKSIDFIYSCGPEIMMKKILDIADRHAKQAELSLERYMKCGFGVCGQCCVDNLGIRVCKEGPVMKKEIVRQIFEFSKYKRNASGKKMPL